MAEKNLEKTTRQKKENFTEAKEKNTPSTEPEKSTWSGWFQEQIKSAKELLSKASKFTGADKIYQYILDLFHSEAEEKIMAESDKYRDCLKNSINNIDPIYNQYIKPAIEKSKSNASSLITEVFNLKDNQIINQILVQTTAQIKTLTEQNPHLTPAEIEQKTFNILEEKITQNETLKEILDAYGKISPDQPSIEPLVRKTQETITETEIKLIKLSQEPEEYLASLTPELREKYLKAPEAYQTELIKRLKANKILLPLYQFAEVKKQREILKNWQPDTDTFLKEKAHLFKNLPADPQAAIKELEKRLGQKIPLTEEDIAALNHESDRTRFFTALLSNSEYTFQATEITMAENQRVARGEITPAQAEANINRQTALIAQETCQTEYQAYLEAYRIYQRYLKVEKVKEVVTPMAAADEKTEEEKTAAEKATEDFKEILTTMGIRITNETAIQELEKNEKKVTTLTFRMEMADNIDRTVEVTEGNVRIKDPNNTKGFLDIKIPPVNLEKTKKAVQQVRWDEWFAQAYRQIALKNPKVKNLPETYLTAILPKLLGQKEYRNTQDITYGQKEKMRDLITYLSLPNQKHPTIYQKIQHLKTLLPKNRAVLEKDLLNNV